jgi:7-keto-8-aminopelargonate synthetase-like enzyme
MIAVDKRLKQKSQKQVRTLFPIVEDTFINLSSADYLNLSFHPFVKLKGVEFAKKWGAGHLSTRPLISYEDELNLLEERFANFLGKESVTFFEHDDGLIEKIAASFSGSIRLDALNKKTGMLLDLDEALKLKENTQITLILHDSETLGVIGNHGFGIGSEKNFIDVLIGSFPKRFGSYISFVATSKEHKKKLFELLPILHKEKFIPPLFLGMLDASIHLIPSMKAERKKIHYVKTLITNTVRKIGFEVLDPKAPCVSFFLDTPSLAKKLQLHLADYFFYIKIDHNLVTFFPNLFHTEKEITNLYLALSNFKEISMKSIF